MVPETQPREWLIVDYGGERRRFRRLENPVRDGRGVLAGQPGRPLTEALLAERQSERSREDR